MKRSLSNKDLPNSALEYILESLVPFTDANLKLGFKPNLFFNDLENISRQKGSNYKRQTFRNYFYKAKQQGLITIDENNVPRLTPKGSQQVRRYKPKKLGSSAHLLVVFDIPESERGKRRQLRLLLKELKFTKVQQSVWKSIYDHREYLKEEIRCLELDDYVEVYESVKLT